ncbi:MULTISPECIES: 1-phosphofructokinase family hexose kinase [Streptomyces]|uniref:1-phosphofructokinase family hexose kinase n=1 Tax=Streptomyces salyersiae TaxID=3075530 RepID=A0ABU2RQP6_9ACTN|nr:1-phosphofructokinase family hexose kinase [Streptomyces sp. DSM 41770]MDT0431167.1 1-phosphofructokinase family hexose kinase [Streptomyces sp. DSM 41770]
MILTVTLNAALDVTYNVDALVPHGSHRVDESFSRAGGKGVNVARVLSALGVPAVVTGLVGGPTGRAIRDDLGAAQLVDELVPMAGDSRRTVTVVSREDGDATVFNQSGPHVDKATWADFLARFTQLVRGVQVVVLAGSLPPGLPTDAYARLTRLAADAGAMTVVDAGGPALLAALGARPTVVKPNAAELAEATGHADPEAAVASLRARGAVCVVASHGPEGLHAVTPAGAWRAVPPRRLAGNPTGAGDACVAAIAAGLLAAAPWPAILREAVALSAAAVPCPLAGDFDAGVHEQFRTSVPVAGVPVPTDELR